jgi:hypothetical protein
MKTAALWDAAPCSLVEAYRFVALMMEAASTSETSVNLYQSTRRNNPEYSHIHTRHLENLISHDLYFISFCSAVKLQENYAMRGVIYEEEEEEEEEEEGCGARRCKAAG